MVAVLSLFMDRREFQAQFKTLDDTDSVGSFEGIAAVFSNIDRQHDVIQPGAFTRTLPDFIKSGFLANAHDWSEPVGTIDEAIETNDGLYVRGKFHSTPNAQLLRKVIRERLERGKDVAMSIGYQITEDAFDSEKSVRMLKELELFEVSVVSVPANPLARLASVKQIEPGETEEVIEERRFSLRRTLLTYLAAREQ
jgi:hypothetical protein